MKLEGQIKDTELKGSYKYREWRKAIFEHIIDEKFLKTNKGKKITNSLIQKVQWYANKTDKW